MTEKQKYYALLSLVCETLPRFAVDRAIRAGYGQQYASAATRLAHVKQGKVAHLPDLVALVTHSMPGFAIPAHLRPTGEDAAPSATAAKAGTPLFVQ